MKSGFLPQCGTVREILAVKNYERKMRLFLANFTHCAVQTGHFLPSSKGSLKKIGDLVIAKDFVLVKISLFKKK